MTAMPLTFGQIANKVSELLSKIALKENFVLHLRANYKSSDAGEAEMYVVREDHATVSEDHIDRFIEDTVDEIDQLRAELLQWQNLPIPSPEDEKPKVAKKGKKRGSSRRHQNQSPPGDGGTEEA